MRRQHTLAKAMFAHLSMIPEAGRTDRPAGQLF